MFTSLERRCLCAADPVFSLTSRGTLIVRGSSDAELISINVHLLDNKKIITAHTGPRDPDERVQAIVHTFKAQYTSVTRVRVEAGAGDDLLSVWSGGDLMGRPVTLLGQEGDDTLPTYDNAPSLLDGGTGNDSFTGGQVLRPTSRKNRDVLNSAFADSLADSPSTILGGEGDDTLGGDVNDRVDGGAGNDMAWVSIDQDRMTVTQERADQLARDFFARINASSIETASGFLD